MEKNEKVDFILEQMRLCLAKKDYIRTQIISKKISTKFFENNNEQVRICCKKPFLTAKCFRLHALALSVLNSSL